MRGGLADRYAETITTYSKAVVAVLLVVTLLVAAGAGSTGEESAGADFEADSAEQDAQRTIEANFSTDDAEVAQVVVRGDDVLTRESLLESLRLQQEIREDDEINATLQSEGGVVGLENVVALAAIAEDRQAAGGEGDTGDGGPPADGEGGDDGPPDSGDEAADESPPEPTLDDQIEAIESRDDGEIDALLERVLDPDAELPGGADPYEFLPNDYEPGSTSADARTTFVFQVDDSASDEDPEAAYAAQVAIAELVDERFDDAFVFGQGIVDEESSRAFGDSFAVITPVALVLVLGVLGVAYRDVVDVAIGLVGIGFVMAWLGGLLGWLSIPTNQILIAVPFLLIGLSIDYSLHVVMRYREVRSGGGSAGDSTRGGERRSEAAVHADGGGDPGTREGMRLGLAGVILALGAATFSTGIGFLSNYVSPLPAIRDFAVISAAGIVATLIVFGAFVPALKLEVDALLERFGRDRNKPAFGVSAGPVNRLLSAGVAASTGLPAIAIAIALVLAAGGGYAATDIDTEFNQQDFLPEDAPEWSKTLLPGSLAPGDYSVRENAEYLSENFQQRGENSRTEILIRGDVADPDALDSLADAEDAATETDSAVVRSDGRPAIESPATLIRAVADEDESFAELVDERDTDGDGLPDEDVATVYDALFDADEERASEVLHRTDDGAYDSARLEMGVSGEASAQQAAEDTRTVASAIEDGAAVSATPTGPLVVTAVLQDSLLETLVEAFFVTLVVILAFLAILYTVRHRQPDLAVVTLVPVVVALAWLLGAMSLLDLPFNTETAVITSLAIGLGVDYSIHLTERIVDERAAGGSIEDALERAVTGTGGALLGSAATTAAGFGVLAFALVPPLRRFGLVTGMSIVFAFLACVTILPSLFVIRERLRVRLAAMRA